jgi:membrane-associated phospholipid phosphatase
MKNKSYFMLTGFLFLIVAILHFSRIIFDLPLILGSYEIPMSISWLAVFLTAILAYHGFCLQKKSKN